MVAEDEVGRQLLAHRRRVRLDPAVELRARAVLEQLDLVPLVAVEHEDGQQAADVGPDDAARHRGRSAPGAAPGRGR